MTETPKPPGDHVVHVHYTALVTLRKIGVLVGEADPDPRTPIYPKRIVAAVEKLVREGKRG